MKKYFIVLIAIFILLSGCKGEKEVVADQKKAALQGAVSWYCALLADGYRTLNMNPLSQVATPQQATKAYHYMAATGEAGLKMDATLKKIEFTAFREIGPNKAEVATKEVWDYLFIEIKSGKSQFANRVSYTMTYQLEEQEGRWLVAAIAVQKTVEEKYSSPILTRPANIPPGSKTKGD